MIGFKDLSDEVLHAILINNEEQKQYRQGILLKFEALIELYKRLEKRVVKLENHE